MKAFKILLLCVVLSSFSLNLGLAQLSSTTGTMMPPPPSNCTNDTNTTCPPFDPARFVNDTLNNASSTFPSSMTDLQKGAYIKNIIDQVAGAFLKNATMANLTSIIMDNLKNITTAFAAANTAPKPADNSTTNGTLFLAHVSAIPGTKTQHIAFNLIIRIANVTSGQFVDPTSIKAVWNCNKTGFFGNDTNVYTSLDNNLAILDTPTRVKPGDVIQFNATVTRGNDVKILQIVVAFVGSMPALSVLSQADDSQKDAFGVKRVVTLQLTGLPDFLTSTASGAMPANVTFDVKSLVDFYNPNFPAPSMKLGGTLMVKFPQPIKTALCRIRAMVPGAAASFDVEFNLTASSNPANLPSATQNLSALTPTADNIGDVGTSIANKFASQGSEIAGNLSALPTNASNADKKAACTASGGNWTEGDPKFQIPPGCKPALSDADKTQVKDCIQNAFTALSSGSSTFSAADTINFVKTAGTARENGVDLPASTISTGLDQLATACQDFTQNLLLSGDVASNTETVKSTIKSVLSARSSLVQGDAEKVATSSDSTTLDGAKSNQRKSLQCLDEVLSAFSAVRSSIGSSMTISEGDDTIHSEDVCLSAYSSLGNDDLITIRIDPSVDSDASTTTKFGFGMKKSTLQAIISDKTGNSTDCLNVGGIKTSKATGACGHQGADKMSNEIVGFKVFDSSGSAIDVTGYTLYLEIPLGDFKVNSSFTPSCKYLNTSSEIPANGGSFYKLGANNDTAWVSISHLSSYALSSDSSSSSSGSTTTTTSSNTTIAMFGAKLDTKVMFLALLSIFGLLFLN